ncbi:MAG TPA: TIGR00730 family Rossman fold protein [Streptosporangiaceae bacterium]|nr:TIGR00730 family Rossman fold protein [Streptosporangiaceae bacterium]
MVAIRSLCVFCGSSTPADARYSHAARALGGLVASRGIDLVYGGGRVGLMGQVADAALAAGGRVFGVIPTGLFSVEVGHTGLTELHEVGTMHERKQLMYDLSDGFIALPGGLGTLEELAEVTTWSQLGLHAKPVVLLDVDGFWEPLVAQLDRMVDVGLLKPANRQLIQHVGTPQDAVAALTAARPRDTTKRITPGER